MILTERLTENATRLTQLDLTTLTENSRKQRRYLSWSVSLFVKNFSLSDLFLYLFLYLTELLTMSSLVDLRWQRIKSICVLPSKLCATCWPGDSIKRGFTCQGLWYSRAQRARWLIVAALDGCHRSHMNSTLIKWEGFFFFCQCASHLINKALKFPRVNMNA